MRALVVVGAIVGALGLPAVAAGGGWATVGFAPLPDGTSAGGTWNPTIFVKQHGVTPLSGLQPVVVVENVNTGNSVDFAAAETSEAGVYAAEVVFPTTGDWRVTVRSGFGDSHVTYGPVTIGPAGGGGDSQPSPFVGIGITLAVLVGGFALLAVRRSRRLTPASG